MYDGGSSSGSSGGGSGGGSSSGGHTDGGDGGGPGSFGETTTTQFTLINTSITTVAPGAAVNGFDPIKNGATIDLAVVGDQLNMRADPPPSVPVVGSMAFALDATYTHTANTSPYSLCGDDGPGKFKPCTFSVGPHTLTVTTYPAENLGGTPYTPTVFQFTIVDSNADAGTDAATD
jgi:hypothetical protein